MLDERLHHAELTERLRTLENLFQAIRNNQADAIIGSETIESLFYIKPRDIELALRNSEEKFRTLWRSGHFAIQLSKVEGHGIVDVNSAWCTLTGMQAEDVAGHTWEELGLVINHGEDGRRWLGGDPVQDLVCHMERSTGERLHVRANASEIGIGENRYWLTTLQDITAEVSAQEALREAHRRKDAFLATLAHELRNPLAPLRSALEIVEMVPSAQDLMMAVAVMQRQVDRLTGLINDLMDISRITHHKVNLDLRPIDLQKGVAEALEAVQSLLIMSQHVLTVNASDRPMIIQGDHGRIVQVFTNLLSNAIKFTEPGGRIQLDSTISSTDAIVHVSDSGIGIQAGQEERIFEMFTQVASVKNSMHAGLGIGLSLVKNLVELHGGTIHAESEGPGQGSTFVVKLPLAE